MLQSKSNNCTSTALSITDEMYFKELDAPRLSKNIVITLSVILPVLCVFGYLGIIFPSKKKNFLVSNVEKNSIKSQVSNNGMLRHSFWLEGEIICLQHIMRPF